MIKFSGALSNTCKIFIFKMERKIELIVMCILCFLLSIPFLYLTIYHDIVFILVIAALLFFVLAFYVYYMFPSKKKLNKEYMITIAIEGEEIECDGPNYYYCEDVADILKVIDYGEFFHIKFLNAWNRHHFICEKSLLVEGRIEEFEEMFADKIVSKEFYC